MFCEDNDAAEQAATEAEREGKTGAVRKKSMSGPIGLTAVMAIFSAAIILVYGFEDGDGMAASATAIVLSVAVCGVKWFIEIKNQTRRKKETEEKKKGSDCHVL